MSEAGKRPAIIMLPATEATLASVELSGSGYNVVIRLVGEADEVEVDLSRT